MAAQHTAAWRTTSGRASASRLAVTGAAVSIQGLSSTPTPPLHQAHPTQLHASRLQAHAAPSYNVEQDSSSASSRPQPGRTSPALLAKRAQQARDALSLTHTIMAAKHWKELEAIFHEHKSQFSAIHMSALMTRLARLTARHAHPSPNPQQPHPPTPTARLRRDAPAIRMFMSTAVPYIGMHMLKLAPRQLANIMWALGSMGYTPQPAWVVEWGGCMARKLSAFTLQDLCMSAWGLSASGCTSLGLASGAPGALLQLVKAAVQPATLCKLQPRDVSNLLWAAATSGLRPPQEVLQALASRASVLLRQQHELTFGVTHAATRQQHVQQQHHHEQTTKQAAGMSDTPSASWVVAGALRDRVQGTMTTSGVSSSSSSSSSRGPTATSTAVLERPPAAAAPTQSPPPSPSFSNAPWGRQEDCVGTPMSRLSGLADATAAHSRPAATSSFHSTQQLPSSFMASELVTVAHSFARLRYWPGEQLLSDCLDLFLSSAGARAHSTSTINPATAAAAPTHATPHALPNHWQARPPAFALSARLVAPTAPPAAVALGQHEMHSDGLSQQHMTFDMLAANSMAAPPAGTQQKPPEVSAPKPAAVVPEHHQYPVMLWSLARLRWRPLGAHVAQLLAGCLGSTSSTNSHHTPHTSSWRHQLSATDVAQVVWSLGALRFQPQPACRQQLLRNIYRCLVATAHAGGVAVSGSSPAHRDRSRTGKTMPSSTGHMTASVLASTEHQQQQAAAASLQPGGRSVGGVGGGVDDREADESMVLQPGELALVLRGLPQLCNHPARNQAVQVPEPLVLAAQAALAALAPELHTLPPTRILGIAVSVGRLHITPPVTFMYELIRCVLQFAAVLPPSRLVWLMVSLAWMRQRVPPGFVHAITRRAVQLMTVPATDAAALASMNGTQPQQCAAHSNCSTLTPAAYARSLHTEPRELDTPAVQQPGVVAVPRWPGPVSELVLLLWALRQVGSPALPLAWSDVIVRAVGAAAPGLRPQQLGRLVDAVRKLRLRPQVRVALHTSRALLASAAARSVLLRCDELCSVEYEGTGGSNNNTNTSTSVGADASNSTQSGRGANDRRSCGGTLMRACSHLRTLPRLLRSWFRRLAVQQRRMRFRNNRCYPRSLRKALSTGHHPSHTALSHSGACPSHSQQTVEVAADL